MCHNPPEKPTGFSGFFEILVEKISTCIYTVPTGNYLGFADIEVMNVEGISVLNILFTYIQIL
jgi:hypothetical protein